MGRPRGAVLRGGVTQVSVQPAWPPPPCFLLLPGSHSTQLFLVRTCVCAGCPPQPSGLAQAGAPVHFLGSVAYWRGMGRPQGCAEGLGLWPWCLTPTLGPWPQGCAGYVQVAFNHSVLASGLLCRSARCRGHGLGARQPGRPFSLCKSDSSLPLP